MHNVNKMKDALNFAGKTEQFRTARDPFGNSYTFQLVNYQSKISGRTYRFWEPTQ